MTRPPVQTPADHDQAYAAAQAVVETHRRLAEFIKPGMRLPEVDAFVGKTLADLGCKSCFLGYRVPRLPAFPSHACLSVNECVVHGTAGYTDRPLQRGDLFSIDIGVTRKGWIGDAAWTYAIGEFPSDDARRLCEAGKESLRRGIDALAPGQPYLGWAEVVEHCVEREYGLHLVRGLGGHGYGRRLHAPPFISNTVPFNPQRPESEWPDALKPATPGTLLALEPMLAIGTGQTHQERGGWPIYSADGSLTVHYEHDVLITETGTELLTEGLDDLPEVIG
ncbi:MAG: M24 family metallopeptidase [Planctomycetota bacterium]